MSQPNLLQRAKQGDSDAIAALMNLTLQDKGVAAKVVRIQDYLHISFSATKALNQDTLTEFTRQGLQRLEVESIQTVKVYGLKTDQELPDWVATFQLGADQVTSESSSKVGTFWGAFDRHTFQHWRDRGTSAAIAGLKQSLNASQTGVQTLLSAARSQPFTLPTPQDLLPPGISLTGYIVIASGVTVSAFVLGGMVAGLAISQGEKSPQLASGRSANAIASATSSPATQQQAEVKHYLTQMIESQKLFYQQNQRLAKNLEELERSAAVVSHSYSYTYRAAAQPNQFQLLAVAKTPGLKSYSAIVVLPSADAPATIASLCETTQPTQVAPIVPWTPGSELRCPAGTTKVQ
jgi:hypothetical protein